MRWTGAPTAVAKWGNSAGVRIPKQVLKDAHLKEGDKLVVEVEAPGILRMRAAHRAVTLNYLVSRVTKKNRHAEVAWGDPRGKEIW